jgi:hypothetical protein
MAHPTTTPVDLSDRALTPRSTALGVVVAALPAIVVSVLAGLYHLDPKLYLRYVLQSRRRELQAVELATFVAAAIAGVLLVRAAWALWAHRGRVRTTDGAVLVGALALAALFFAGEEISWGQSLLGFRTPDAIADPGRDLNIHNQVEFPVQSLGSLFLLAVFIALPVAWRFRRRLGLPASLAPAIAEWPLVVSMALAFTWTKYKDLYRILRPDWEERRFYWKFVEQINEHKEMLIAFTLLAYAVYRLAWWRRASAALGPGDGRAEAGGA